MRVSLVRAKLHHARVTDANVEYKGSIGIDQELLDAAGLYAWEKVLVVDLENGNRLETYIIPAEAGSKTISLNGAAARLVDIGDRVIIMAFAELEAPPPADWEPRVIILDDANNVDETSGEIVPA